MTGTGSTTAAERQARLRGALDAEQLGARGLERMARNPSCRLLKALTVAGLSPATVVEQVYGEPARENVEAATVLGDRVARARGRLTGRVVLGTVENPRRLRLGPRTFEDRFELRSTQRILHVRLRDELLAVDDPRLKALVEDVRRDTGSTVLSLRMLAGQRAVGIPAAGATLELVDGVPNWNRIWRLRGHLKKVLANTPWTHRDDGPPVAAPRGGARPPDLLAAIDTFR
jgi:hypothetical protein